MNKRLSSEKQMASVSVVIMTLNAEEMIGSLLEGLVHQTVKPMEIIVADSESNDRTVEICNQYEEVRILAIKRMDFNHGGSRDLAFKHTSGDFVLFMTHDAEPCDSLMIENLLKVHAQHPMAAAVYGRQLPKDDATYTERLIREYNYPDRSHICSETDIIRCGIKTFFLSDVCAMYRRSAYVDVGGFEKNVKTNEDMFFAAAAIRRGYTIAYSADAKVKHSHNLTLREQYKRNFIQGYEIARHKKLLASASQHAEGLKLVKYVSIRLLSKGRVFSWVRFGFDCCARYAGNYLGKRSARIQYEEAK